MRSRTAWVLMAFAVTSCGPASPSTPPETGRSPAASSGASPTINTGSPVASATPGPSGAAAGEWAAVFTTDDEGRVVGDHIVHADAGFLALGSRYERMEGGPRPVEQYAWFSPDGRSWTEIEPPAVDGGYIHAVTSSADGDFVVYFNRPNPPESPPANELAAIRSADGRTWTEFDHGLPSDTWIDGIGSGPLGYLLSGGTSMWLSSDGVAWEPVLQIENGGLTTADVGEEGYVALGTKAGEGSDIYVRFTTASEDGREWIATDEPFGPSNQEFQFDPALTAKGPDWIALLPHPHGAPTAAWHSADGIDWTAWSSLEAEPHGMAPVLEDTSIGLVYAPGGGGGSFNFEGIRGAWTSDDGREWTPIDIATPAWVAGLAEGSGVVALLTTTATPDWSSTVSVVIRSSE